MASHPSRVRELKHPLGKYERKEYASHPSRVRELKRKPYHVQQLQGVSHPSRVRELKRIDLERVSRDFASRTSLGVPELNH